ncbi:MAG: polyribonucleotide nucleotidyltransferase [Armatimonadetes bacterium CP1_7O]|nr:MAG: polyribonucleotide nucleotidyltransferase [Armatimonadetes bacterium CP1_7O]
MREPIVVSAEIGGDILSLETGAFANQANAAVVVRYGDTVVLVTATMSQKARADIDFFPLIVDYEERKYAVGKIPGGFVKRGGRPSDESIVQGRLVDRSIRPLFPKGMRNEVQVIVMPLSVDFDHPPAVLGIVGASAALTISDIPWNGPLGAVRVGYVDGELILNPNSALSERSDLELVVASRPDHVMMIEADANQLPEEIMLQAIELAHQENQKIIALIEDLRAKAGKTKAEVPLYLVPTEIKEAVKAFAGDSLKDAIQNPDKLAREAGLSQLKDEIVLQMNTPPDPESPPPYEGRELELSMAVDEVIKETVRKLILEEGKRPDGRAPHEIREIACAVGLLPRTHGSGLFQRGQTQVLTTCTLGALQEAQILDALSEEETKRYMHFYNFPPFSVGEVRPLRGAGRREVGHGMLAERALQRMIPPEEEFPYAILLYSEVLESNGSTSMASTCGSTLALMDAGVPIKAPVAGIATGLVYESEDRYVLLTDIQGMEDATGDMDFKVAGTENGITAIQLDLKIPGLPHKIIAETLQRARESRLFILQKMLEVIPAPRPEVSPRAPRIFVMEINPDKIGEVIGPGGKTVKKITAETGAQIQIEQTGKIYIAAPDGESGERARQMIEALTKEVAVGEVYTGRVTRLMSRGAFVEVLPGKEGLVDLRDLTDKRVNRPDEVVKVGDTLRVRVKEIDHMGRINLTTRGLEQPTELDPVSAVATPVSSNAPRGDRRPAPPRGDRRPDHPARPEKTAPAEEDIPKPQFRPKR